MTTYTGRLLRVDLTSGTTSREVIPPDVQRRSPRVPRGLFSASVGNLMRGLSNDTLGGPCPPSRRAAMSALQRPGSTVSPQPQAELQTGTLLNRFGIGKMRGLSPLLVLGTIFESAFFGRNIYTGVQHRKTDHVPSKASRTAFRRCLMLKGFVTMPRAPRSLTS